MYHINKLAFILCVVFLFALSISCRISDKEVEDRAHVIAGRLDTNSIKIFRTWNYHSRGNSNFWENISGNHPYHCSYFTKDDSVVLELYQPMLFLRDFNIHYTFDTLKFKKLDFYKSGNCVKIYAEDTSGHSKILTQNISIDTFTNCSRAFEKLEFLTKFKDSLQVYGITYQDGLFELYLSSNFKLLYANEETRSKFGAPWIYADSKRIKKDWFLFKMESISK